MGSAFSTPYPEASAEGVDSKTYDYVVIGGGTAGCVLASRLSEDEDVSVLVLERGPVSDTWVSRVPLLSSNYGTMPTFAQWDSEPMTHCTGERSWVCCGEGLGGTSRINGMLYTRGSPAEYDHWAALGHPEWAYEKVKHYFVRSERSLSRHRSNFRGSSGPWQNLVSPVTRWPFQSYKLLLDCAQTWGLPYVDDGNSPDAPPDKIINADVTIDAKQERMSTYRAFLPLEIALERKHRLTICTRTVATQLGVSAGEKDEKRTVHRIYFRTAGADGSSKEYSVYVTREAILCAGAMGSPHLLMSSGIGPRRHLEEAGVQVNIDLPGVGSYLADHMCFPLDWEVPVSDSLNKLRLRPWIAIVELIKYIFTGLGLMGFGFLITAIFVRRTSVSDEDLNFRSYDPHPDRPDESIPDIELMPVATSCIDPSIENLPMGQYAHQDKGAFSIMAAVLRPKSRGSVRLNAENPRMSYPKVDFGFLSDPSDYEISRKAVRLSLKFGDLLRAQGYPLGRTLTGPQSLSEEDLDDFIRKRARTTYHYTSTCRMAAEDDPAAPGVVDDNLKVYGMSNLRVCDASIFPEIMACHPQAVIVMVAEKCSDMIKHEWR